MNQIEHPGLHHQFIAKIKALGFSLNPGKQGLEVTPIRSSESWILKQVDERWILMVNNTPQISFSPEEVIKFLNHRIHPKQRTFTAIQVT